MPKQNPAQLPRPEIIRETKVFTDELQPGIEIELTFEASADSARDMLVMSRAEKWVEDHIRGRNGGPPAPLPPVGGREVKLSEKLLQSIALLEDMEIPEAGDRKWELYDWIAFAVNMPNAFIEVIEFAGELSAQARNSKNPSRADAT